MKAFKELSISFDSSNEAETALNLIKSKCVFSPFIYSDSIQREYNRRDITYIRVELPSVPVALMAFICESKKIRLLNIFPYKYSADSIDIKTYNQIVDKFNENITLKLFDQKCITVSSGVLDLLVIIPRSYEYLYRWVTLSSSTSPWGHPMDRERWFKLIVSLVKENETLNPYDLERWLVEEQKWSYDITEEASLRLEENVELLKYFIDQN